MGILINKYLGTNNAEGHISEYSKMASTVEPINFLPRGSDELFVRFLFNL